LKSNFEFWTFLPVYLEKIRDLTSTEPFCLIFDNSPHIFGYPNVYLYIYFCSRNSAGRSTDWSKSSNIKKSTNIFLSY
jgi:hypothetical protein